MCDLLVERLPTIKLDRDALFVREDPVWIADNLGSDDLTV
jgi:hypothetical protein